MRTAKRACNDVFIPPQPAGLLETVGKTPNEAEAPLYAYTENA